MVDLAVMEGVRKLRREWDQKGISEKKYWVIKANVPEQTKQKSIHERLEEKKRDVGQKQKKERKKESWKRLPVELGFDVDRGGIRSVRRKDI